MNNITKFTGKAKLYDQGRPKYAKGLFTYLKDKLQLNTNSVIADVGSGTGIFTEQLLEHGYKVFAVEPNQDMRLRAEQKLATNPNFVSVDGRDTNTTLNEDSVDCVTVAQALHWFDLVAFRKECQRILKPNGIIVVVYNQRDTGLPIYRELAKLNKRYCPQFHGFSGGNAQAKITEFFNDEYETFKVRNPQKYSKTGFVDRVLSSSYSLTKDDKNYQEYLAALERLFDHFSCNDFLNVPIYTVAYSTKIM